ncbi:hypothetical protein F5Y12DRAFT_712880 [Xylaria sp. FL1777]|nr:hypothetical protein F5Y12DRAFT_712880 [Xylaria sp. FL1777]
MSRQFMLSTFRAGNGAFEAAARRTAGLQLRSFTSTAKRNESITHFTPTSSAELDSLLANIRHKIILPAFLPTAQRRKIFLPKWQKKLDADPITMEIDGEVLKFRYVNPLTEVPSTPKAVGAAVVLFNTPADFANLRPLLEGLYYAGRTLSPQLGAKILRLAGSKGQIYSVIDCARSVRQTGFQFNTHEKAMWALHFIQMNARHADWDEAKTRKALRWAEMVIVMLQTSSHKTEGFAHNPPVPGELPISRDPMVLAAPLHLAAVLAARYSPDEEILDRVYHLARDVVALWPEDKKFKEIYHPRLFTRDHSMRYLSVDSIFINMTTPLLHGLETAAKVVVKDPELARQLQIRFNTLRAEIKEIQDNPSPNQPVRPTIYNEFYKE